MEPIKFEDLAENVKLGMVAGRLLAAHMVVDESGLRAEHYSTVQPIGWVLEGGTVYHCSDVCQDDCEPDSVRLVMPQMPQMAGVKNREKPDFSFPPTLARLKALGLVGPDADGVEPEEMVPSLEILVDVGKMRDTSNFADSVRLDEMFSGEGVALRSPLERLSSMGLLVADFAEEVSKMAKEVGDEVSGFLVDAERAFADQARLEELREWTYSRYRNAVHNSSATMESVYAATLFFIVTGMKPSEDRELHEMFSQHLMDAVVLHDAEQMPEFRPEPEQDCGD